MSMKGRSSPLLRKAGLRSVGLGKRWKQELDKLCRQAVFARDKECQWCKRPDGAHQWAHIRSRRYLASRWDLRNSLRLCAGCHLLWHHQPLRATEWFRSAFPERMHVILLYDHGTKGWKIDREAIRLELEQEIKRWEGA